MELEELVRPEVVKGEGYPLEALPFEIKMDANEFPYSLADQLGTPFSEALKGLAFNRYPDPLASKLREQVASYLGIRPEMVIFGNGSDELIQILLIALGGARAKAVVPVPSFAMYQILASFLGYQVFKVSLDESFDLDVKAILRPSRRRPKILLLGYPNNPTGNCYQEERVFQLLEDFPGIVLVDEAYYPFSGRTFLPHLKDFPRLLVFRTFSKVGLAGLRVGILIGHPWLVKQLAKVKLPYNLGHFPQVAARVALENWDLIEAKIQEVICQREIIFKELQALPGVHPYPSQANFILFRLKSKAGLLHRLLLEQGISVKNLSSLPLLRNCLRVTVGTPRENRIFLQELKEAVEKLF